MFTQDVQCFTDNNAKTFIPMRKPHFHTCVNTSEPPGLYPLSLMQKEKFPGLTSSLVSHWGLCPHGWNLMLLPGASTPIGDSTETQRRELLSLCTIAPQHHSPPSSVPCTLGPCWLSPALLPRCLNCRQRPYKRQRLVQVSVRPLSYSSVCLRPLRAMKTQLALAYPFITTFCLIIELN